MSVTASLSGFLCAIAASATLIASATSAQAEALTFIDIAGREVTLSELPDKIILGEGRMMYAIAPLIKGNPFEKIVGWNNNLIVYDPDGFRKFQGAFPEDTARLINFGNPYAGDFSIEAVLESEADLVLLESGSLFKAKETGLIEKLNAAGVEVAFIDFRRNATENVVPSLLTLGRILGEEKSASEFIDFYLAQMRRVTNIVDTIPAEDRPMVVVENAAGWQVDFCCWSFGPYNYGRFVELAGGTNYASTLANAYSVTLNLEGVIEANPKHIVATGANWAESRPEVTSVLLGYDADDTANQQRIDALAQRAGFADLEAVKSGNYHAIFHQFYNSPYHFVAIQQLAKWFHPDAFEDLDPQATFDELHERFLPFDTSGTFWMSTSVGH